MVLISEILHKAADKELAWDAKSWENGKRNSKFSCSAISEAVFSTLKGSYEHKRQLEKRIQEGLKNMGLDVESHYEFIRLGYKDERLQVYEETQGARYIWLKFAALMAEKQGV
jgi:hypothetical protein